MDNEQLKNDLNYIRATMRKVMQVITGDEYTDAEKRNMVGVFNTLNNSAKILVSTYITEIANERMVSENSKMLGLEEKNDENKRVDS